MTNDTSFRDHLLTLLDSGDAHLRFDDAVKDFPVELRGKRPAGGPHSPWELLEHLRIAQSDLLEFSRDASHISPEFPAGYWPASEAPPTDTAWDESVAAFRKDQREFVELLRDSSIDLHQRIPHGNGQTVLRQILVAVDHKAYHLGQLVTVRAILSASLR